MAINEVKYNIYPLLVSSGVALSDEDLKRVRDNARRFVRESGITACVHLDANEWIEVVGTLHKYGEMN